MFRRPFYSTRTVDYQVSQSELDFIKHLEEFNYMPFFHDDQKIIDYYVKNFNFLIKYAFRTNEIRDKHLYLKAVSVFNADHPTMLEQFHKKTRVATIIFKYLDKIKDYKSESHAAFFDLLPKLIIEDKTKKIYPEFMQKIFFQTILDNIAFEPAFDFLCNLPNLVSVPLHKTLFTIELPQMIMKILRNDRKTDSDESEYEEEDENDKNNSSKKANLSRSSDLLNESATFRVDYWLEQKIQRTQDLFINYIKQKIIVDIPATLMMNDSFEIIVQKSIIERRAETFKLIQFLMTIQNDLYPSNQWDSIYAIILNHFNDYCSVILNTKPFGLCSKYCLNLVCAIIMSTRKTNDSFIEVFLMLTDSFFQYETISKDQNNNISKKPNQSNSNSNKSNFFKHTGEFLDQKKSQNKTSEETNDDNKATERNHVYLNHNTFLHNCYLFTVQLLLNLNLLTEDLLEKSSLPNRIVDFFLKKSPKMFASKTAQCIELFYTLDPILSNLSLVSPDEWEQVRKIADEKKNIMSKPYGKDTAPTDILLRKINVAQANHSLPQKVLIFSLLFALFIGFFIKFE